jgi:hypothetical protein
MTSRRFDAARLIAILAVTVASVAVGACSGSNEDARRSPSQAAAGSGPPSGSAASTPAPTPPAGGTSSSETAKASDEPMKSMTKEEEANSMPQPGQANDHSTVAKDPK